MVKVKIYVAHEGRHGSVQVREDSTAEDIRDGFVQKYKLPGSMLDYVLYKGDKEILIDTKVETLGRNTAETSLQLKNLFVPPTLQAIGPVGVDAGLTKTTMEGAVQSLMAAQLTSATLTKDDIQGLPFAEELESAYTLQVLQLPWTSDNILMSKWRSKLLVRQSYKHLWSGIRYILNHKAEPKILLLGTPGTGKSTFTIYILYHLLRDPSFQSRPIVFDAFNLKCSLAAHTREVDPSPATFETLLSKSTTIYLFDAFSKESVYAQFRAASSILISSPDSAHYPQFHKEAATVTCYMPVWSEYELYLARKECFPTVPLETLMEKYCKWGGIVRYVLEHPRAALATLDVASPNETGADVNMEEHVKPDEPNPLAFENVAQDIALVDAISKINVLEMLKVMTVHPLNLGSNILVHRILHFDTSDYVTVKVKFASSYIRDLILKRAEIEKEHEIVNFLRQNIEAY
eukprot:Colp12_sorted_trinity150504_noHs@4265